MSVDFDPSKQRVRVRWREQGRQPGRIVADAVGAANDLEAAVDGREHRAQRTRNARAGIDAGQRGIESLDVGCLDRYRDVEVHSGTPPSVQLRGDAAHNHQFDAMPCERPQ